MDKAAIDIAKALARLSELTICELRGEWRRLHRMPPPMRLSRDLLTRGISYKLQERAYGGLSAATARTLEQAADSLRRGAVKPAAPISLRHAARAGVARGHPHAPHPCRRDRVARSALPRPLRGRAKDHGRSLVGPAVFWPRAAADSLYIRRESEPWLGLIKPGPGSPSAARSTPENRRGPRIRSSILSTPSGRLARPIS
jgi:hypothetical protein